MVNQNNNNIIGVTLEFNDDTAQDRTWVDKDRFDEFESAYQQSQDYSSLANTSSVEFEIHIKMLRIETKLEDIKKIWIPMTTVYGGDNGVKLLIKHKIIEMVYAYEDSDWGIQSMIIMKLYKQKKETTSYCQFQINQNVRHDLQLYRIWFTGVA